MIHPVTQQQLTIIMNEKYETGEILIEGEVVNPACAYVVPVASRFFTCATMHKMPARSFSCRGNRKCPDTLACVLHNSSHANTIVHHEQGQKTKRKEESKKDTLAELG